jgi:hypothetical protein
MNANFEIMPRDIRRAGADLAKHRLQENKALESTLQIRDINKRLVKLVG